MYYVLKSVLNDTCNTFVFEKSQKPLWEKQEMLVNSIFLFPSAFPKYSAVDSLPQNMYMNKAIQS